MRQRARLIGLMFISILGIGLWLAPELASREPETLAPKRPRLAVIVVFDQLRGDYLARWQPLFGAGGFKRLQEEGAWFTNCHYPYAFTLTAPGHTSLVTGCSPNQHGIIGNEWLDRASRETVGAVEPPPEQRHLGPGPYRRRQESLGDVLLRVLMGKGRVASFSIKDRSAILLAALRAQMCYWFENKTGQFITSRYYRDEPHSWVKAFNKSKAADRWLGTAWERLRPDLDYARASGPDDVAAEGLGFFQGRTFPHPFDGKEVSRVYYEAMTNSPKGNELLLELAKTAIAAEKLGQTDTTDLLCLSFSSNDLVGHCWGPDSQEVLDITLRADVLIKDLLDTLDTRVGKGNYVLALSADHGVCPLPEVARTQGKVAERVAPDLLTSKVEQALAQKFAPAGVKVPWLERPKKASSNPWIYLNQATLKEQGIRPEAAEQAVADWLVQQPGIAAAFTRSQMRAEEKLSPLGAQVRKSFRPESSGDIMAILQPYHLFAPPITSLSPKGLAFRTSHGTPHSYDTHVPLLVFGPGVRPGVRSEPVTPQALAGIVAHALGLPRPAAAEAPVPADLFAQ
jgi:predicted AlkP superfamily pyrophosphatase or phosphodiesterase